MVTNFLNALDRIPKLMEQYKSQNAAIEKDLPTLREIVGGTWKKENELKHLKSEVPTLEREIQLTLTPSKPEAKLELPDEVQQRSECNKLQTVIAKNNVDNFTRSHILVVKSGLSDGRIKPDKGMKL